MDQKAIDLDEVLERVQNDRDLLLELIQIFLDDCAQKIGILKTAVEMKNFQQAREIAHSLKGASANISAKKVSAVFSTLEQMAKNNDLADADVLLAQLDSHLKELEVYFTELKRNL